LSGCGTDGAGSDTETQESTSSSIEVTTFPLPDGPEESDIYVEPISDISDDFIRGVDASSVLVEGKKAALPIIILMVKNRMSS